MMLVPVQPGAAAAVPALRAPSPSAATAAPERSATRTPAFPGDFLLRRNMDSPWIVPRISPSGTKTRSSSVLVAGPVNVKGTPGEFGATVSLQNGTARGRGFSPSLQPLYMPDLTSGDRPHLQRPGAHAMSNPRLATNKKRRSLARGGGRGAGPGLAPRAPRPALDLPADRLDRAADHLLLPARARWARRARGRKVPLSTVDPAGRRRVARAARRCSTTTTRSWSKPTAGSSSTPTTRPRTRPPSRSSPS